MNSPSLDSSVLGRILLLQSSLQAAPDERRLAEMVAQGLGDLPGIAECFVCLDGEASISGPQVEGQLPGPCRDALAAGETPGGCPACCPRCAADDRWCHVLQAGLETFGVVTVCATAGAWLQAYSPFLANTANLAALQIQNRRQAKELQALNRTLQQQVVERTAALREHEQLLAQSQQIAHIGSWLLDRNTGQMVWSDETYRIFGLEPHAVAASFEAFLAAVHPEDRSAVEAVCAHSLRAGDGCELEHRVLRGRTGETVSVFQKCIHQRDAAGNLVRSVGTIQDISQRKRAEESLQMVCFSLDRIADAVFWADEQGRVLRVNQAACRSLGYSEAELLSATVSDLDPGFFAQRWASHWRELKARGSMQLETSHRTKDGRDFPVEVTANFMRYGNQEYNCAIVRDVTDRRRAEWALRESEENFRSLVECIAEVFYRIDETGVIKYLSPSVQATLGFTPAELLGRNVFDLLHPEDRETVQRAMGYSLRNSPFPVEFRIADRAGTWHWFVSSDRAIIRNGQPAGLQGICQDITERKLAEAEREKLQTQLTQAQRMESIGRLAGGVAHDFNNMLQAILGNVELALLETPPTSAVRENLVEIRKSASRSADLTRQLLAFARKQTIAPKLLDLNETIEGTLRMLRRLIGEAIDLVWLPSQRLQPVKMDPSQIDQILTNLCVNARDAIGGIGRLTIQTGMMSVRPANLADYPDAGVGDYVRVTVRDTGCGMDRETLAHVFEPFFTTKEFGQGTGLGLATVLGIVQQNGGFIRVDSAPGQGTTFHIHLPRCADDAIRREPESPAQHPRRGSETILLVEDEPAVLRLGQRSLERLGYQVLTAATPGEAERVAESHTGQIDLLLTDVVMPEMTGRELAERLVSRHPTLKRLFMSGYSVDVIAHDGILDANVHFLPKPFTISMLADQVRAALQSG